MQNRSDGNVETTGTRGQIHTSSYSSEAIYDAVHWFAIYTYSNREKIIAAHLESRGIEHFLPLYQSVRNWSDRKIKLELPLFPGYLFVRASLRNRLPILTVPGVVNIVSAAGIPIPLASEVIGTLREGLKLVAAQPYPYLAVGQRVSISSGPLKGLSGVLLRHKPGPRVVISIDSIERSFLVDVPASDLVPIGPIMALESIRSEGFKSSAA